jgi:hypothetical protein
MFGENSEMKMGFHCKQGIIAGLLLFLIFASGQLLAGSPALDARLSFSSQEAEEISHNYLGKNLTKKEYEEFIRAYAFLKEYEHATQYNRDKRLRFDGYREMHGKTANEIIGLAKKKKPEYVKLLEGLISEYEKEKKANLAGQKEFFKMLSNVKVTVVKHPVSEQDVMALSLTMKNTTKETLRRIAFLGTFIHSNGESSLITYRFEHKILGGLEPGESRQMTVMQLGRMHGKDDSSELTVVRDAKNPIPIYVFSEKFTTQHFHEKPRYITDKSNLSQGAGFLVLIRGVENANGKLLLKDFSVMDSHLPGFRSSLEEFKKKEGGL